jgi:membrane protein
VPARGWRDVLTRTAAEMKDDHATLLSAGVAFYFFLALVPALIVAVAVFGIVADPADVRRLAQDALRAAPQEVRDLVVEQLRAVTRSSAGRLSLGALLGVVVALWSASSGMGHLVEAVNAAFDEHDDRGFVRRRLIALGLTLGAMAFAAVALFLIAVLPSLLADTALDDGVRLAVDVLRWPLLAVGFLLGIGVLYRVGPDRDAPRWRWVTPGALLAMVIWIAGSLLFSLYAANLGRFQATYGALASIIVLMLWLLLTAFAVIAGAEVNAELERQTRRDSTEGPPRPMGARGAHAADTLGPTAAAIARRGRW